MGSLGSASIKLNLDRSQFDSDLKKLQATDAGQIAYRIKLDTKDFERQLKGLSKLVSPVFIPLEIDTKTFDQQIKKLSTSIDPIKVDLAPNVKDFQEKLRRLSKITPITVDIKVDEAKVRQQFETIGKYAAEGFTQGFAGVEGAGKSAIDSMVKSVNRQLGIQSPSKVFREIGKYAIAGLMQGLDSVDESKLKGVVNKIEGYFKKSNIQISVKVKGTGTAQVSQPVQPKVNDNTADLFKSFESNLSNSIEKGFRNASKKGLFATLVGGVGSIISGIAGTFGSLAMGLILSPFKAGIAVVTTVLSGVGEKLGHELSSGVTSGLKSAIGGALSNFVGSGEIVGNALGEQIAESTGAALKRAMPSVASLISDSIREVLGSEKVATAAAVRRNQTESTAAENKQVATKQIQKEFSGAVNQGLPARAAQLKSEIAPVLPQLQKDDAAFQKEFAQEKNRLEKAAKAINVKLTPRKLIERRVKEYEAQIAQYTKLKQSLEASGDTEKASQVKRLLGNIKPPDQDEKNISQSELRLAEAKYTGQAQQKFVSDRLSSKFGLRQAELSKRKAEVTPKIEEIATIQQKLGQIGQDMETVGVAPPKPKAVLPQGYLRVLEETLKESGVEKLETSRIPELVISKTLSPATKASYDHKNNAINVDPETYERISTGKQDITDTVRLSHEIRHGVQTDFGRMPVGEKRAAIPLLSATPEEAKHLGEAIDGSTNIHKPEDRPFVRSLETDAYVFQQRHSKNIHEKVEKDAAVSDFSNSLGFAGVKTENKLKDKQKAAFTTLAAINAASREYGIDTSLEISTGIEEIEAIRAGINPLLAKAKNLEVLPSEQIRELQKDIESAIADAFTQIESISQDIQQSYSQKLSDKETERELERQFEQSLNPQAVELPKEIPTIIADVPPPVVVPQVSPEVLQAQSVSAKLKQEEAAKQEAIAKLYTKTGDKGAGSKDKLAAGAKSAYRDVFSIQDTFKGIDIEPQVKAALKQIQELNSSLSPILLEIENAEKLSLEDISQITGQIEATITLISHKIQEIPHQLESQAINISNRGQQSIPEWDGSSSNVENAPVTARTDHAPSTYHEWDMGSSEYLASFKAADAVAPQIEATPEPLPEAQKSTSNTSTSTDDEIAQLKKQIAEEKAQAAGEGLAPLEPLEKDDRFATDAYTTLTRLVAQASGVPLEPHQVPKLAEMPVTEGSTVDAAYSDKNNTVEAQKALLERLRTGFLNKQDVVSLAHELRHGVQSGFGERSPTETNIPLLQPNLHEELKIAPQTMASVEGALGNLNTADPRQVQKAIAVEDDAYTFESRNLERIFNALQKELSQYQQSLKQVYLDLAKSFHPDLAKNEQDKASHANIMQEANQAYKDGDADKLLALRDKHLTPKKSENVAVSPVVPEIPQPSPATVIAPPQTELPTPHTIPGLKFNTPGDVRKFALSNLNAKGMRDLARRIGLDTKYANKELLLREITSFAATADSRDLLPQLISQLTPDKFLSNSSIKGTTSTPLPDATKIIGDLKKARKSLADALKIALNLDGKERQIALEKIDADARNHLAIAKQLGSEYQLTGAQGKSLGGTKSQLKNISNQAKLTLAEIQSQGDPASIGSELGANLVGAIGSGISGSAKKPIKEIQQVMASIEGAAKNQAEIKSPSRVFQRIGKFITEGLALGISEGYQKVAKAITDAMDTAKNTAAKNPIPPAPWEVDPALNFRNPKAKTTDRLEAKINAQRLEAESKLNQKIPGLELLNELDPSVGADLAIEDSQKKKNKRGEFLKQLRENPLKLLQGRSKNATIGKARYLTENAEGLASLAIAKVGDSPTTKQRTGLLNLQDAFGDLGEKAVKFGQTKSEKDFKLLNAAVRELESSLRALGIPFELINHEIDAYTAKLKKMQAEGKIDLDVDVSSLAPEKFSFIDNILSKFSGLELKGLKAIGGLVKGFLAFGAIAYVQNLFTDISVNAFKAFVELDRLKTALNFASGGSAGGAQNLAFVRKTVEDLKVPLEASTKGFVGLAAASRNSALEGKGTRELFLGISQASTVLSLSADDTQGSILALSQMISKGKVSSEELRQQLGERLPGAIGIAARAMGLTEMEFTRLLDTGQILSQDFLPKFAKQLQAEFGDAAKDASVNAQSAIFGVQNAFLSLQQGVGEGVAPAATAGLNVFAVVLKGMASVAKELGFALLAVSLVLSGKMLSALGSVLSTLIQTRLATGTLSGGMQALGQTINNSASVKWAAGIFAVLELVNLLNSAINTELVQSFQKAADAAKRAAEETKKAFEKPKPESSNAGNRFLDKYAIEPLNSKFGAKIETFAQKEQKERELGRIQGLDPVATSGFGRLIDNLILNPLNMVPGGRGTTYGDWERDETIRNIDEQGFSNTEALAEARYQLSEFKTGKGAGGKLRPIDAQLKAAEEQRAILQAQIKRDFVDKGQTVPADLKRQLDSQNLKVNGLNDQRAEAAKPISLEENRITQKINFIKSQLENFNNPDTIANLGGEAATDIQRQKLKIQLEPLKQVLAELQAARGALRIDPILAFTQSLRKLNLVLAEGQEKSELRFNQSRAAIASTQLKGFSTNKLATRNAALQNAIAERDKNQTNVGDLEKAVSATDATVNASGFQTTLQRLGVAPDASVAKIDDVLKNTTDEADKGILEKLKSAREQKNKLSEARVGLSESQLKVKQTTQDNSLFSLDESATNSRAATTKAENQNIAGIKRALEAKVLTEEVANEKISRIQLTSTRSQEKSLRNQLSALRTYYDQGAISAEEFAKRERDLTTEQTNLEKQEAENRLAVQSTVLARRLKEIEFFNKKAEALTNTKQADSTRENKEKLLSAGLTPQAQDQFALAQTKADATAASDRVKSIKARIAQNKELYKAGLKDAREFMLEEYALNQELASANLAVVDQKISAEEKYRETVEHNIQRIMALEENRFKKQTNELDESKSKLDLYNQSLERTNRLEQSRRNLSKALSDAAIAPLESKKADADDALGLVEKLKDPKLKPQVKAAIKAQLEQLGFGMRGGVTITPATVTKATSGDTPEDLELRIKEKQAQIEREIEDRKQKALLMEQEFQRKTLENDLKRQKIAAQIALYEAQSAQLSAQKAKNEAEGALKIAIAKKDPIAIQTAQTNLEIANKQIGLSNERIASAQANLNDQPEIAANSILEQNAVQGAETSSLQAASDRRRRSTALNLVESSAQAGKPINLSEAEAKAQVSPGLALPQRIDINQMPKLDLKPGENLFEAYQRQRTKVDIPPMDKTALALNSASIQPRESAGGNQFVEALKMANQGIEQRLDNLKTAIIALANTPRSLTVQTPNPVDDAAKLMSDMSRGQLVGAGL